MAHTRSNGAQPRAANLLAAASLCADERYYRELALPLMRRGASRRARDLAALFGPPLTLACALFIVATLALAAPARIRQPTLLAPLQARLAGMPTALVVALVCMAPLLIALAIVSLWARSDSARERRVQATLEAKLQLARGYRQYLTGLAALTEPLSWLAQVAPEPGEPERTVLVALSMRHDARWDDARLPAGDGDDSADGDDDATRPGARYGWDASVEAARRELRRPQTASSVAQALAQTASGAIILCGGEGAGKTTLMRHAAHTQALAQLRRTQPDGRIPLYADLAWLEQGWPDAADADDADDADEAVETALAALAQRIGGIEPAVARALGHAMARQPALLLFDELDTLPAEQRERVASSLAAYLAGRRRAAAARERGGAWATQVVIGSRRYTAPLGDGPTDAQLQRWELEPLAYPMGRLALVRGTLAQASSRAPDQATFDREAEAPLRALAAPQTEVWLTQPLALTLAALASVGAPDTAPCRSRTDLYAAVVESLLRRRLPEWSGVERRALWRLAEETALWLQARGQRVFSPGAPEIDEQLIRLPEARIASEKTGLESPSQALATVSGLCALGPGALACFSFGSLHSFLAGCALARHLTRELPAPLASNALTAAPLAAHDQRTALALAWSQRMSARWEETLLFMCGALCALPGALPVSGQSDVRAAPRADLAVAWLRALLDQRDQGSQGEQRGAFAEPGLLLAAASLPELRGNPAGASAASEIAERLHQMAPGPSREPALRALVAVMADPVGRQATLDLLSAQLLGADARAARRAVRTLGALGQAGVSVAPLLTDLLRSTIWAPRAAVARAIGALGPIAGAPAIPALVEALDDRTLVVRVAVIAALGAVVAEPDDALIQRLLTELSDREGDVRAAAAVALGKLGAASASRRAEVAEALIQALSDTEIATQVAAATSLGALGDASVQQIPTLIETLAAEGWSDRASAALALGELGPRAVSALPALMELARDETLIYRTVVAQALARIGPPRAEVVAALIERLADDAHEARRAAATALGQMDSALPAMRAQGWPALLAALRDPRERVRQAAARALDAQGAASDPQVAQALVGLLDDGRGYVRSAAALPLATLGGAAARALPARIASLGSLADEARLVAVEALGMLGADARVATPALTPLVTDERWEIRRAALRALRRIGPPRAAIAHALARMSDAEAPVRLEAVATLEALDSRPDRPLLEALQRRLLDDSESSVRAAAAQALARLGPSAAEALPTLLRALGDSDEATQRAAALAIGALRLPLTSVMPLLIDRLSDPAPGVRGAVALALGAQGPVAAPDVTPELLTLLRDGISVTRASAAEALGLLGPQVGDAARRALVERLNDADGETRAAAAGALGQIGAREDDPQQAQSLVETLVTRTYDKRYVVRRAAINALTALGPSAVGAALARLLELLGDADVVTRRAVAAALATLDAAAQAQALPALCEALGAASADERAGATLALVAMRPVLDASDGAALIRLLADPSDTARAAAAQAIGALSATIFLQGPPSGLGALLSDGAWEARATAAEALGHYGARVGAEDRGALRAALADPDETTRQAAAQALAQIDPEGARTLVGELLQTVKARRATGPLAPLAQRRELEVYAAMERATWATVARVSSWLSVETHWATVLGACALIERWRYAPAVARARLLWLSERAGASSIRTAARPALLATLTRSPDLEPSLSAALPDLPDVPERGAWADTPPPPRALSAVKPHSAPATSVSASDGAYDIAAVAIAKPAADLAPRRDASEGKTA